jgi:hypothetical protein
MSFKLPENIYSIEQLEAVAFELREYIDWSRSAGIKSKVASGSAPLPAPVWTLEMQSVVTAFGNGKALSTGDVEELIKALDTYKHTAPVVHLTLAGMPGSELRMQLIRWFRANVHPGVLMSFRANRQLLGGMVLRAGSRTYDYSWRGKIVGASDQLVEAVSHVRK